MTTDVGEGPERLLRRCVAGLHDDRRHVRADRYRGEIERAEPLADLLEPVEVARVPGEVRAFGSAGDDPAAPEATVAIPERAAREVLGRHAREREPAERAAVPPVELVDVGDAEVGEPLREP